MTIQDNETNDTAGPPPATGVFKPRFMEVDKSVNVDEVFQQARRISSGEFPEDPGDPAPNVIAGQRAVAIITPERQIRFDRCPAPDSMPEKQVAEACTLVPRESPLMISAICYTNTDALILDTNLTRTIPFRGILNAWAYAGHNVIVFEGSPSALESGVRDCDVLLVDSGMLPFIQFNWADVARRVMRPSGRIFVHNRESYTLSLLMPTARKGATSQAESDYVELLLRFLMRSSRSTVEITSGEVLPDLADLLHIDVDWVSQLTEERSKLNPDAVIDILLKRAGWRWYLPFKTSGTLVAFAMGDNGKSGKWKFSVTLGKTASGKRQVQIDR